MFLRLFLNLQKSSRLSSVSRVFRKYILPRATYLFYRFLVWSWRIHIFESPELLSHLKNQQPVIFAHWHGDEIAILHCVSRFNLATMTSTSKDGSLINYVIQKLGGVTSRGSSTRGGTSALKGLIRLIKKGHNTSFAVDGPKGPLYKVKPGVFELSRLTGAQIVPIGVCCYDRWDFPKAWNKTFVPKPFSKVAIYFDSALPAIDRKQNPRDSQLAENLAQHIKQAQGRAVNFFAQN